MVQNIQNNWGLSYTEEATEQELNSFTEQDYRMKQHKSDLVPALICFQVKVGIMQSLDRGRHERIGNSDILTCNDENSLPLSSGLPLEGIASFHQYGNLKDLSPSFTFFLVGSACFIWMISPKVLRSRSVFSFIVSTVLEPLHPPMA